jgi:hypothetical protein
MLVRLSKVQNFGKVEIKKSGIHNPPHVLLLRNKKVLILYRATIE